MARKPISLIRCSILASALALFASGATAGLRTGREMTLQELTKASDSVITGKVTSKEARLVGARAETYYEVEVTDVMKGKHAKGKRLQLTVPGGELTTPPLTQYVQWTPHMYQGEDVALFLKDEPYPAQQRAAVANPQVRANFGPQVVGWYEGKFSVFTDQADKRQKVTRIDTENLGYTHQDRVLEKLLRAYATHQAATTSGPVIDMGGGVTLTPDGKALFDRAAAAIAADEAAHPPVATVRPSTANAAKLAKKNQMVEDLEDFKSEVRSFAK